MTDTTNIRRRPDGSIDTDFYIAKSHLQRSQAARDVAKRVTTKSGTVFVLLAALGLSALFSGSQS